MPDAGAFAQDLKVFGAGASRESLNVLGPEFTKSTGTKVTLTIGNPVSTEERLKKGEAADVVMTTMESLNSLAQAGIVVRESIISLGDVPVGLAVRAGAPVPDISTADKLRATLLAAKSVSFNDPAGGSTAGITVGRILKQLGIAEEVAKKAKFERPAAVAKGEIEINMTPIAELVAVEGITIVGPLPAELKPATPYGAAVIAKTSDRDKATAFVKYLARPESLPTLKAKGVWPTQK
jgi:molybdate transport system substrate-binding protein